MTDDVRTDEEPSPLATSEPADGIVSDVASVVSAPADDAIVTEDDRAQTGRARGLRRRPGGPDARGPRRPGRDHPPQARHAPDALRSRDPRRGDAGEGRRPAARRAPGIQAGPAPERPAAGLRRPDPAPRRHRQDRRRAARIRGRGRAGSSTSCEGSSRGSKTSSTARGSSPSSRRATPSTRAGSAPSRPCRPTTRRWPRRSPSRHRKGFQARREGHPARDRLGLRTEEVTS